MFGRCYFSQVTLSTDDPLMFHTTKEHNFGASEIEGTSGRSHMYLYTCMIMYMYIYMYYVCIYNYHMYFFPGKQFDKFGWIPSGKLRYSYGQLQF